MSVSVRLAMQAGALSFPVPLQFVGVVQDHLRAMAAQLPAAHAARSLPRGSTPTNGTPALLRGQRVVQDYRPDKAPRSGALPSSRKCRPSGSGLSRSTSSIVTTRRNRSATPKAVERELQFAARAAR